MPNFYKFKLFGTVLLMDELDFATLYRTIICLYINYQIIRLVYTQKHEDEEKQYQILT